MARFCTHVGGAVAFLALMAFAGPASAQKADSNTTLFLIARSKNLSEEEISSTLKRGLKASECTVEGDPGVRRISAAVYDELEILINNAAPARYLSSKDLSVAPLPARDALWEFRIPPTQLLKNIKVKYRTAGDVTYTPKEKKTEQTEPDLSMTTLGRYALKLKEKDEPLSYEATLAEPGKDDRQLSGKWPTTDNYFLIALRGFEGNRERLFRTVSDKMKVANPFKNIETRRELFFVFANLDAEERNFGTRFNGNKLTVSVEGDTNVKRVWMLFPLTAANAAKALAQYRKFGEEALPAEVRKNAAKIDDPLELTADMAPVWIELPSAGGKSFIREVAVKNQNEFLRKYPQMHRLLVWEFDDGTTPPGAIRVTSKAGGRELVIAEQIDQWGTAPPETPTPKE